MDHWLVVLGVVAALIAIGVISRRGKAKRLAEERRQRREALFSKYGNDQVVQDIIDGVVRQGMTLGMVLDSWGNPAAVDEKVYRTKTKQILKYHPGPRRTFASRVTVEDGIVVGWVQR
jgi:hypothetical protein